MDKSASTGIYTKGYSNFPFHFINQRFGIGIRKFFEEFWNALSILGNPTSQNRTEHNYVTKYKFLLQQLLFFQPTKGCVLFKNILT
jgi:hypothetical protein